MTMKSTKISFRPVQGAIAMDIDVRMPSTVAEALEHYGEEGTLSLILRQAVVDIQGVLRSAYNAKEPIVDPKALSQKGDAYRPGVHSGKKSQVDKVIDRVNTMSDEEKRVLLLKLTGAKPKAA